MVDEGDHGFTKDNIGTQHIYYGSSEAPTTWPLNRGLRYQTGFAGKWRMAGEGCAGAGKRMGIF